MVEGLEGLCAVFSLPVESVSAGENEYPFVHAVGDDLAHVADFLLLGLLFQHCHLLELVVHVLPGSSSVG